VYFEAGLTQLGQNMLRDTVKNTSDSQNMLGNIVKHLGFPKHAERYSKTLEVPKTCWEIW
jgi:hypothetical protein